MEQKEYPVGSRFQVNGQWYEVKPCSDDIECSDCCFNSKSLRFCDCSKPDSFQDCIATFRKDNADVYFAKIDPPTDFLDASPLTRPIGSTFYDHGIKLKVCDSGSIDLSPCYKFCHYSNERCGNSMNIHGFCGNITRLDHKDVYFTEVTDENSDHPLRCLVTDNKPVDIHLILTYHWYGEIDAGRKWVVYCEQSDYYKRMLLRNYKLLKQRYGKLNTPGIYLYKNIRSVIFHRGYTSTTMRWAVQNIKVGYGDTQKGAPYHPVFCIRLGKRYKQCCNVAMLHQ